MSETLYSLSPCAFCMCFVIFIFFPSSFKSPRYTFFFGFFFLVFAFKSRESTKTCYLLAFLAYSFIFFASSVLCPCLKPNRCPLSSCCIKVVATIKGKGKKRKESINFCVIYDPEGFNKKKC